MSEEEEKITHKILIPAGATTSSTTQIRNKASDFKQVYANNVQIGFSSFDMGLTFGQITGEEDGKTVIEETVRILMPRELGKLLAGLLMQNVISYEQQFGEIKIPTLLLAEGEAEDGEEQDSPPEQAMTRAMKKRSKK